MWLSPALLLLCLSGSLSLTGPSSVTGTLGGSLSVQCQYEEGYQKYKKYWCRGQYESTCEKIVETNVEEKEETSGRMSIRDHTDNLTFIVTMENLTTDDAGTYWCRIQNTWLLDIWLSDVWLYDPSVQVKVFVSPAPGKTTGRAACRAASDASLVLSTKQNFSAEEMLTYCSDSGLDFYILHGCMGIPHGKYHLFCEPSPTWGSYRESGGWFRSSFSSIHLLLLVFLKLPLFLTLVGAVLWVNRPLRGPGGRQPDKEKPPCRAPSPGMSCSGKQPFRPDRRDLQTPDSRAGGQQCLDSGGA